jgi:hypothetical protein
MTATFDTMLSKEQPSSWNMLFAEESDKDLDFDEGFEEDELNQSKPPSRRPLLWIVLLLLVGTAAYWMLNNQASQVSETTAIDLVEDTNPASTIGTSVDIASPLFGEDQSVVLAKKAGETRLTEGPSNSQPGPMVKSGEQLIILDGSYQITGWIYQVKTPSGKTGWISEDKLKQSS